MHLQESFSPPRYAQLGVVCFGLSINSFNDTLQLGAVVNDQGQETLISLSRHVRRRIANWQIQWATHMRVPQEISLWLRHQELKYWPVELQSLASQMWLAPREEVHRRLVVLVKAVKAHFELEFEFEPTVHGQLCSRLDQYHYARHQLLSELDAAVERRHFGYYKKALDIMESHAIVVIDSRTFIQPFTRDAWSEPLGAPDRVLLQAGVDDFITLLQFHAKRLRRPLLKWQDGDLNQMSREGTSAQTRAKQILKAAEFFDVLSLPAQCAFDDAARQRRRQELIGLRTLRHQSVVVASASERDGKRRQGECKPWWPLYRVKPVIPLG